MDQKEVAPQALFVRAGPFRGRSKPPAELLELGLKPSDSEKFFSPGPFRACFPKRAKGAHQKGWCRARRFYTGPARRRTAGLNEDKMLKFQAMKIDNIPRHPGAGRGPEKMNNINIYTGCRPSPPPVYTGGGVYRGRLKSVSRRAPSFRRMPESRIKLTAFLIFPRFKFRPYPLPQWRFLRG